MTDRRSEPPKLETVLLTEWLDDLKAAPPVELPESAAEELAAARRDGDL